MCNTANAFSQGIVTVYFLLFFSKKIDLQKIIEINKSRLEIIEIQGEYMIFFFFP